MKIRDSFPQVYYKSEQETLGVATIAMICSTLASSRPCVAGGAEGASTPPPPLPKFSANMPFFSDELFKCALFERSNPEYT